MHVASKTGFVVESRFVCSILCEKIQMGNNTAFSAVPKSQVKPDCQALELAGFIERPDGATQGSTGHANSHY